jgi:hypothetical protein
MPNTESVDIFGRRRRHPEKRVDCAAKRVARRKRKPSVRAMIKDAEKDGKKVSGATVAADGSVSLQFGEAQIEPKSETDRELEEFNARHG